MSSVYMKHNVHNHTKLPYFVLCTCMYFKKTLVCRTIHTTHQAVFSLCMCVGKCGQPHAKLLRLSTSQRWSGEDPALGYDWIAGLVEAGSVLEGREDGYFEEMREFRKVNHSECSRPHPIL